MIKILLTVAEKVSFDLKPSFLRKQESRVPGENRDAAWTPAPAADLIRGSPE
jgi:hypothetical protein